MLQHFLLLGRIISSRQHSLSFQQVTPIVLPPAFTSPEKKNSRENKKKGQSTPRLSSLSLFHNRERQRKKKDKGKIIQLDALPDMPLVKRAQCAFKISMTHRSAIRINYRALLRSSSMREPRHPLLGVVSWVIFLWLFCYSLVCVWLSNGVFPPPSASLSLSLSPTRGGKKKKKGQKKEKKKKRKVSQITMGTGHLAATGLASHASRRRFCVFSNNDPSAGSPTKTLLRLLLPLDDKVQYFSRTRARVAARTGRSKHLTGPSNR